MTKTTDENVEDMDETPEEALNEVEMKSIVEEEFDETITIEDEKQAVENKKSAALRARHALEDYFESKKLKHELDYLIEERDDKKKRKK